MTKLADDIIVRIGGEAITLRPCLRFAIRLERRPGSFSILTREIMDGSLSAAVEIIRDHTVMPDLPKRILETGLPSLTTPLLGYVMGLAGIDPDDGPANDHGKPTKQRRDVPFSDYLANLYRIGTGWLGWTPKDTLEATPLEILEAYKGRLELLRSVFGGKEDAPDSKSDMPLDQKFKTAFGSFGTTIAKRKKAA
ncbi:hypothetical protein ABGN05_00055 [Aquibium sp. LZ166]|uniref:Tail assembly chaperone n=1 Tax=Aquibium pacificus TaxID=3153579 RepID=A0ABV3SDA6_9HYPH